MWKKILAVGIMVASYFAGYFHIISGDLATGLASACLLYIMANLTAAVKKLSELKTFAPHQLALKIDWVTKAVATILFGLVLAGYVVGIINKDLAEAAFKAAATYISADVAAVAVVTEKVFG